MSAEIPDDGAPPRELRKREVEVIAAAIDVFWRKGYAAASVADVAEQVGMLKGSLYYYIDTKEDLLVRIFQESNHQAIAIVAENAALDVGPIERLRAYFERYLLWYLTNLERVSLYFSEWRHLTGERRETVREQRSTFERYVRGLIEAAQDSGEVSPDLDPGTTTSFLMGGANSVATWYRRDGAMSAEEVAERYAELIVGTVTGAKPVAGGLRSGAGQRAAHALDLAARTLRRRRF